MYKAGMFILAVLTAVVFSQCIFNAMSGEEKWASIYGGIAMFGMLTVIVNSRQ